jgi:hypothetical protein
LSAKHQRNYKAETVETTPSVYGSNFAVAEAPNQVKLDFAAVKTITAQELIEAENFPNACSLDDPDCMACSA